MNGFVEPFDDFPHVLGGRKIALRWCQQTVFPTFIGFETYVRVIENPWM